MRSSSRASIDVARSVRDVYDRWTDYENLPDVLDSVVDIHRLDDATYRWHVRVGGFDRVYRAEIIEQVPDRRVAWRSLDAPRHLGSVTFEPSDRGCRLTCHVVAHLDSPVDVLGFQTGIVRRAAQRDLDSFAESLANSHSAFPSYP